jgi:hypothetical protein
LPRQQNGRRYRYYVTKSGVEDIQRLPAGEIEPLVLQAITTRFNDRAWLVEKLIPADTAPDVILHLTREAAILADNLRHRTASRQRAALDEIVESIIIRRDRLSIVLKANLFGFVRLHDEMHEDHDLQDHVPPTIEIDARFEPKGKDLRLIVPPTELGAANANLDKTLIKAVARGVTWYEELTTGRSDSMRDIATLENVSERYVAQLIRLAFLAPDLIAGCLDGTVDLPITSADIAKGVELPQDWAVQRQQQQMQT